MPGIDPSIPLQVRQQQPINPLADFAQILQLKQAQQLLPLKIQEAQQNLQESQLKTQAMQEAAKEQLAIKQIITKNGGDIDKSVPEILQVAPKTGLAFATSARQSQQEALKATGEKLKNAITSTELGARVLQGVPDAADPEAAYQQSIKVMQALGLDHGQMSPTYDPQQVQQYIQSGLSTKEKLEQQRNQLKDKLESMGRTKVTSEGIMQQNPKTGAFDIKVGEAVPTGEPKVLQGSDNSYHVLGAGGVATPVIENGQPLIGKPAGETGVQNKIEFQDILKKIAPTLPNNAMTDSRLLAGSIRASKAISEDEKNKALAYLAANPTPASTGASGIIRMEALGQQREYPVINKSTGQLEMRNSADINASKGMYAPAGQGATAMTKQAVFSDLHYNIDTARKAISALDSMDAGTRAKLSFALRHTDPASAEQEAVQSLALLSENAMSLRSVAGMGQGSDDLRAAIQATLPSGKSPSKAYALGQLDKFENVVKRLEGGVPKMGDLGKTQSNSTTSATDTAQGGYIVGHKYGGLTYNGGDPTKKENWK